MVLHIDFSDPKLAHRLLYGGGKKQLLARAIGCHKHQGLRVIDATAGLGRDAYVLAHLGCEMTLLERQTEVASALFNALQKATQAGDPRMVHMRLIACDAQSYLLNLAPEAYPDVIYCDPMYPLSDQSALVKKEMRVLREQVGDDHDNGSLLEIALTRARYRVVVKRHRHAPYFNGIPPDYQYLGKSSRFDIYHPRKDTTLFCPQKSSE